MASAALPGREEVGWRPGKRPRPGVVRAPVVAGRARRSAFDEHKKMLLAREQERERRHVEEVIRRLDAIEKQRQKAHERKLDREKRRIAFALLLERSTLTLQRCERGRQARRVARRRANAVATIIRWMLAKIRRAAMIKVIRNRTILRIMVSVEAMVEEQLEEACFVVNNMVAIQPIRQRRSARIIQHMVRRRAALARRSASVLIRAVRSWLARGRLRRARIRRSMRRHRGSLSRRALGLTEPDPFALLAATNATLARGGRIPREVRWWDTGAPIVPRPRWGKMRVENEEARSRQRAASLADLIRSGTNADGNGTADTTAAAVVGQTNAQRRGSEGLGNLRNKVVIGFGKGVSTRRRASMIDPREAEAAAWTDEMTRRQTRKEAGVPATDDKKLRVLEKHLQRQREFEAQQEKRRLAVEKEMQKKEKIKAQQAAEAAKRKALHAELLRKSEEEHAQIRLRKIKEYKEKKAAKELAERKALAAKREEARQAEELVEARRRAAAALFEKEKAERLERARKKRRAEKGAGIKDAAVGRGRKEAPRGAAAGSLLAATAPVHGFKKTATQSRTALAPIAVGNLEGRKRRRVRLLGDGVASSGVRRLRVAPGVRDGRIKPPHGATVSALPVVPGWNAMAAGTGGTDRRKHRRRPPKGGGEGRGEHSEWGQTCDVGDFGVVVKSRKTSADLEHLSSPSGGGQETTTGRDDVESSPTGVIDVERSGTGPQPKPLGSPVDQENQAAETDADKTDLQEGSLGDDKSLTFETLDSIFPPPGPGAESGGGEGLGATSSPGELSPGWSSCSSRDSNDHETSSSLLSDSAAIREGKALLSEGVVAASSRDCCGGDGVNFAASNVQPAGLAATSISTMPDEDGTKRGERSQLGSSGAERKAPDDLSTAAVAQHPPEEWQPLQGNSASFPDNVSDLSDDGAFVHQAQGNFAVETLSSFGFDSASHVSGIGAESAKLLDGGRESSAGATTWGGRVFNGDQVVTALATTASGREMFSAAYNDTLGHAPEPAPRPVTPRERAELTMHAKEKLSLGAPEGHNITAAIPALFPTQANSIANDGNSSALPPPLLDNAQLLSNPAATTMTSIPTTLAYQDEEGFALKNAGAASPIVSSVGSALLNDVENDDTALHVAGAALAPTLSQPTAAAARTEPASGAEEATGLTTGVSGNKEGSAWSGGGSDSGKGEATVNSAEREGVERFGSFGSADAGDDFEQDRDGQRTGSIPAAPVDTTVERENLHNAEDVRRHSTERHLAADESVSIAGKETTSTSGETESLPSHPDDVYDSEESSQDVESSREDCFSQEEGTG